MAGTSQAAPTAGTIATAMAGRTIRGISRAALRQVRLTVEGLDHVPDSGPVVIAARHYHHLYDGAAIVTTVPRPMRVMVALDWVQSGAQRKAAEGLCRAAGWPVVLRPDADRYRPELGADRERAARYAADTTRYLKRAATESVAILRDGGAILVFPEGYPNIDPSFTPKSEDPDDYLPFLPGAVRIPLLAQTTGLAPIPVLPAGLRYARSGDGKWTVALRFGPAIVVRDRGDAAAAITRMGEAIRSLSS